MLERIQVSEADARAKLLEDVRIQGEAQNKKLFGELANHVDEKISKVERGLRAHDEKLNDMDGRQNLLEKRQDDQAKLIDHLSAELQSARKQTIERKHLEDDRFDRPPNLEVLFVTAKKFLTVDAISAALSPWLTSDLSLEAEKWTVLRANPPGKRFIHLCQR